MSNQVCIDGKVLEEFMGKPVRILDFKGGNLCVLSISGLDALKIVDDRPVSLVAQIWAEATACRDGDKEVATLDVSRPVIERVLRAARSWLFLVCCNGKVKGFVAGYEGHTTSMWQICYLAVSPQSHGKGIGGIMLSAVMDEIRAQGYTKIQLKVYADNKRAVHLYEKLRWKRTDMETVHPNSGRIEWEYNYIL